MKNFWKGFLITIGILLIIGLLIFGYVYIKLDSIHVNEENPTLEELDPSHYPVIPGVTHILLVGVDSTSTDVATRSDAMMLLTMDKVHDNIKLTSFVRDAYVNIPGYGYEKLTHAYAYGGPELLIETVQKNFKVDVSKYVVIDFASFIEVMDIINGVEVQLEERDLSEFNRVANENYRKFYKGNKEEFQSIDTPGVYTLNGYQTLAYVRMRKADSVYARDQRQRVVIEKVFQKVVSMPITRYPALFEKVLPYIRTNMEPFTLIKLGFTALSLGPNHILQLEFPIEEYSQGGTLPGKGWVLQWDEATGVQMLHEFLGQ